MLKSKYAVDKYSIRSFFYITGNDPDEDWILDHEETNYDEQDSEEELQKVVAFDDYYDIPLEYDVNIGSNLGELLKRYAIQPFDQEKQKKKEMLICIKTIIAQASYIDVVKPYEDKPENEKDDKLDNRKELKRFFRLNSLFRYVTSQLLFMDDQNIIFLSYLITSGKAHDLVELSDNPPLYKLIALSCCETKTSIDDLLFDDDNNFCEENLNIIFSKAKELFVLPEKNIDEDNNCSRNTEINTYKRLTYQYFKRKAGIQ